MGSYTIFLLKFFFIDQQQKPFLTVLYIYYIVVIMIQLFILYAINVTVEKMLITFAPAEDRTRDTPHAKPTLYHVAIKAGSYRKAVQVSIIPNSHSELLGQFRESDLGCNTLDFMMTS